MRNFKNIISIFIFLLPILLFSQTTSLKKYYIEIPNKENIPIIFQNGNSVKLKFKKLKLNSLFEKFNINNFELAFPGAKNKVLQDVYIIECDSELINQISKNFIIDFGRWEEISPIQLLYIPNDLSGTISNPQLTQSELSFINAPEAWDISKGDGIFLGNSEGAYNLQEDLIGKIRNMNSSNIGYTHGTQVATVAAGNTDNNLGVASSGFNSQIITNWSQYGALIPLANSGARAINMSWGSCNNLPLESQYGQLIMDEVHNMGVVLIAAAGNGQYSCSSLGPTGYHYPASLNHVIAVTSVGHRFEPDDIQIGHGDRKDILENFNVNIPPGIYKTTYNDRVDISAPGSDIVVPKSLNGQIVPNEYQYDGGTSFAAPMTMGVVGLMFGANTCLFPDEVESILKLTAVKNDTLTLNLPYQGKMGAGRLNALDAVDMAKDMALPFGSVEVKNRIIDRWDFILKTSPYEINLINNLVTNNATLNFTARNDIDVLSGDYNPTGTGFVDLKINNSISDCNSASQSSSSARVSSINLENQSKVISAKVQLYSNPNNGIFSIDLGEVPKTEIEVSIFDVLGKLKYNAKIKNQVFEINLPNLTSGIYLVKLQGENYDETIKFIKE